MESIKRIDSRKRKVSLAVFLLTVLGITSVFSSGSIGISNLSFSTSLESLTHIGYDSGTKTIIVTGFDESSPCRFGDLWNASISNGWNVVWNNDKNDSQYQFDAKIRIGDGSTPTYFSDTKVQVSFSSSLDVGQYGRYVWVCNNAHLRFGRIEDYGTKRTNGGVQLEFTRSGSGTYYWGIDGSSSNCSVELYSSIIVGNSTELWCDVSTCWNCLFMGSAYIFHHSVPSMDIFNYIVTGSYGARAWRSDGTYNNLQIFTSNIPLWWQNGPSDYRNCYVRYTGGYLRQEYAGSADSNLIDCDINNWNNWGWSASFNGKMWRKNTFDLKVTSSSNTGISNANVSIWNREGFVGSWLTNNSGQIITQTLAVGYFNRTLGNSMYSENPYNLTVVASGYQTLTLNFTLSQRTNWQVAMLSQNDGGMIERVGLLPVDPGLTSPSGTYRWLDVADQAYRIGYRSSYNYSQAAVQVAYCRAGKEFQGILIARNLKPNFAYQLKLVGTPGTSDNERIGLAGRWWQEEWNGSSWSNGQNLNDKGNGSSPNPNDQTYFNRRFIQDNSSPTGYHYRYTGYLVFDYFITDDNGTATLQFETGNCYHVMWKTSQRSNATNDGPVKTATFDPNPLEPAYDTDYPGNTVSIFGEWERLPTGGVHLQSGEYTCQIVLTEESFHGSGGSLAGNWAAAVNASIIFTIGN
jgi:hypothetical protein